MTARSTMDECPTPAELVAGHLWIATHVARRFRGRGEDPDDLQQVAYLGLVNAARRFDPDHGVRFVTFAMPTVVGEVRRHFRDRGWALRVSRGLQERHLALRAVREQLTHALGRAPKVRELAVALDVPEEQVTETMGAAASYRPQRLDQGNDGAGDQSTLAAALGSPDDDVERTPERLAVRRALRSLAPRDRRAVVLRFYAGMTQAEIAAELGISQVHVSRVLRSALGELRTALDGSPAPASPEVGAA